MDEKCRRIDCVVKFYVKIYSMETNDFIIYSVYLV